MNHGKMILGELHADIPVIQGGMGVGISLSGLAGAVAAAGGIGIISTAQIGFREPDFDRDPIACDRYAGISVGDSGQSAGTCRNLFFLSVSLLPKKLKKYLRCLAYA